MSSDAHPLMHPTSPGAGRLVLCIAVGAVLLNFIYECSGRYSHPPSVPDDLALYRSSGKNLSESPEMAWKGRRDGLGPLLYPPTALPLFWLLSRLPPESAQVIWLALSQMMYLCCALLTVRLIAFRFRDWILPVLLIYYSSVPALSGFFWGQVNVLILLLILCHLLAAAGGRDLLSGIALGLSCCLKPYPAILIIPLILRRRRSALGGVVLAASTMSVLPCLIAGADVWTIWWDHYAGLLLRPAWTGVSHDHSIRAWLVRLCVPGNRWTHAPFAAPGIVDPIAFGVLAGGMAAFALVAWRRGRAEDHTGADRRIDLWQSMVFGSLMLAVSPVAQEHYFIWPLVPLCWLVAQPDTGAWPLWKHVLLAGAAALLLVHLPYQHPFFQRGGWVFLSAPRLVGVWILSVLVAGAGPLRAVLPAAGPLLPLTAPGEAR